MQIVLRIVCWIGAPYFFYLANCKYGFPPDWSGSAGISLIVALVLFLLPFAQEFSVTGVFSFKAKVDAVKKEFAELKIETRDYISQQNSLISNVLSVNNNNSINVHLPSHIDASNAEEKILKNSRNGQITHTQDKRAILVELQEMSDLERAMKMAGLRIEIEHALREELGHSTKLSRKSGRRFLSLVGLWKDYISINPDKIYFDEAMRFVMDVGNAGAHGQFVPPETAADAYWLAKEVLSAIRTKDEEG